MENEAELDELIRFGLIERKFNGGITEKFVPTEKGKKIYQEGGFDKWIECLDAAKTEQELRIELMQHGVTSMRALKEVSASNERRACRAEIRADIILLVALLELLALIYQILAK